MPDTADAIKTEFNAYKDIGEKINEAATEGEKLA